MRYRKLGRTGLLVSDLCFGAMTFAGKGFWKAIGQQTQADADRLVGMALDAGVNFFDTADVYAEGESERMLGAALGARRQDVVVATKVRGRTGKGVNDVGLSRGHIMNGVEESLERLGTDYIDLYQIHRWDYATPIEETMEALNDVVKSGKARYIGASSMFAWQFAKAQYTADLHGWRRFVSMQNHYNLVYREEEREMIPCCMDQGAALIPWSPMARGFFSGNHRKGDWGDTTRAKTDSYGQALYYRDEDFDVAERVQEAAKEFGVSGSQIALAWVLSKPFITAPIIGASRMDHLEQAIGALEIKLPEEAIKRLEELYQPHPIRDHN